MKITVRTRDLDWNENLRTQVERSIEYAVDRYRGRIEGISLFLSDVNGPRGGVDKLCRMTAYVRGIRPVLISEAGDDLLAVLGRAARRLGFRIRRNIERGRRSSAPAYRATIRSGR